MDKTGSAVGAFGLGQQMLQTLQRDLAALRIPADLCRLGEAIDLPRLHEHPPGREAIAAAILMEPIDKTTGGAVPAFRRP